MGKRLFGRYRLHERLGVGGWAEVWRATDEQTGEIVALKRLHPHVARDQSARARLRREAAAVSVIEGPGVVRVRDLVEDGDEVALVMDFVEGEPLSEILARDGSLSRRRAIDVVAQVADALAAAHAAGIVHRDVKPSNIILDSIGGAHLIDFGIAQAAEVTSQLTGVGSVVGTLRYLAPEVLRGEPATPASDVWALGALAYLLVEGEPPFHGVVPAELVAEEATPPARPANAEPALAALLMASLDRDPGARPRDAGAFADRMRAIAADSPTMIISIADPTTTLPVVPPPAEMPVPDLAPIVAGATPSEPPATSLVDTLAAPLGAPVRPSGAPARPSPTRRAARRAPRSAPLSGVGPAALSRLGRGRLPVLAAAVLASVLGVVVLVAGLDGLPDFDTDPDGAAAAGLASPSSAIAPSASPEESGNKGPGGGKDNGKGNGKGKGGD